jgi:3-(3-hydroxy-phenyl)propionate hydroxylase
LVVSIAAAQIVDVAVCGAGPVGLTAAALLSSRGLSVAVLEQRDTTSDEPKAISLDDEALRIFQLAGVIDAVLPVVVPGTGTRYYGSDGQPLFHARGESPYRLGYPFKNPFAQPDLERVLARELAARSTVEVLFGHQVVAFRQLDDSVLVHARHGDDARVIEARYVFGCDGGRSTTRILQGGGMVGRSHQDVWLVVDTIGDAHTERFAMHHGDPRRPHVIVPGLDGRCRYEFRLFDGEGVPGVSPSFDLIHRLVSPHRSIKPEDVVRAVNYRFNSVVAEQWMIGRSFLLGDAAHMMAPFAGQGLNSGVRDAANLAWKVADVLDGRLHPSVLATYEEERRPHALATVRLSERLGRMVMTTSHRLAQRRDAMAGRAMATAEGRAFLEEMRYRPRQQYQRGLVVGASGDALVGVGLGQPLAFDSLSHRVARLDDLVGHGWVLFGVDIAEDDWAATDPLVRALGAATALVGTDDHLRRTTRQVLIDVDGGLNREFTSYTGRFVLLRPDRFVAAAWSPSSSGEIAAQVLSWLPSHSSVPFAI